MKIGSLVRCIALFPPVRGEGIGIITEVRHAKYWNSNEWTIEDDIYSILFNNGQIACVKEKEIEVINEV